MPINIHACWRVPLPVSRWHHQVQPARAGKTTLVRVPMPLSKQLTAEFIGTLLLVTTVVGSGIMAASLTNDVALALLGNTLATGAILVVLITTLGPISGAHFNPVVSLVMALRRQLPWTWLLPFIAVQMFGGFCGSLLAHGMFDLELFQFSSKVRTGGAQWLAEGVATFGLLISILLGIRFQPAAVPWLVGLYITAAYWFTASTSFANPAVTFARAFSDTFAGIRPMDVPMFWVAQILGALIALGLCRALADRADS